MFHDCKITVIFFIDVELSKNFDDNVTKNSITVGHVEKKIV